jgi:N-acetylglucosamine kinase-like BadF-type ATPase
LVGEGKKFKDVESLAKGKLEADRHIGEITKTLDELRAELAKQDYAKSLLEQMNKASETTAEQPSSSTPSPSNTENTTQRASDDIEALVEKVITEKERSRTVTQNLSVVNEEMEKQYGDKAGQILKAKSAELNMSLERLKEIAAESPTAFFQLVGFNNNNKKVTSMTTQSSVRSENFNSNSQERDFEYYQKLRKENRSLYYSPKIQNMMLQDRTRLGDKFYKS